MLRGCLLRRGLDLDRDCLGELDLLVRPGNKHLLDHAAVKVNTGSAGARDQGRLTASGRHAAGIDASSGPTQPQHDLPRREPRSRSAALMQSLRPSGRLYIRTALQGRGAWVRPRRQRAPGRRARPAPPARADAALPHRRAALPGVRRAPGRAGPAVAELRAAGIRGLPQVRSPRAWASAGALRVLPCRALGGLQLQAARVLPQLRRPAHGRERGAARR